MSIDQDSFRSRIIATPRSGGTDDPRKRTFEEREGGPPLQNQPTPAVAASPSGRLFVSATERPKRGNPTQIGRFTVLRPIGQGGMGVVYACYDEQLDRKVAVKVLHVEVLRDLAMARARLLREAQTMARLSHANIVTVYEVGQDDDLVHIAMEFVRGVGLDVWTNPERPWQQLLATFVQAGRGLEAAHRAGIIHRDFKPQNVIVGEDGVVKVLDFGLARAADGNLREEWLTTQPEQEESFNSHLLRPLTRTGLLLGTPAYMSPEQHCGEVATAASDQFSFCVSLYQCLYGVLPFSTTSLAALRHDVMKGHVAPAPLRSPVPLRIFRALRRGMMTNPEARFSSMTELLTTLERDPGVRYRRLAGLTATAALTGALGFTLASGGEPAVETCPDARPELVEIWSDERAAEIRQSISTLHGERGMKLLSLVEPQVERYAQGWVQLRNEACRAHAEGRQSDQLFDLRTACLEQRRASLDALTNTLAELDASSLANIAQATASLPPLETCADAQALTTEVPLPDDAKMRVRVQGHRETLARVQVFEDIGQYRAGLQLAESVLADDLACKYEPLLAEALLHKGSLQMESGDSTEAEKTLSQALWAAFGSAHERVAAQASSKRIFLRAVFLTQWSQAQEEIPEVRALNKRVQRDVELYAEFLNNIAAVASMAGKWAQARQWYEESLALRKKHGHTHTTKGLFTQANLGELASIEKRYQDAVAINREVIAISEEILGPEHPRHLIYKQQLGENLARMGRLREALTEMREIERLAAASDDKELRGSLIAALGWVEIRAGEIRRAKEHFQRALQLFPEVSNRYDIALWGLMQIAAAENDQPGVQRYHDRALARLRRPLDPNDFAFQELLISHGRALATLGHLNEAVEPLARVRSMLAGSDLTFNRIQTAIAAYELGKVRLALGELDEAQEALDSALTNFQGRVPDTSLEIADVMLGLGELALQRQRLDDAVRWLAQAEAIYLELAEPDYPALARTRFIQARALTGSSPQAPPDARTQAELALQAFRAWSRDDEAHAVETWLHDHQSP